MVPVTLHFFLSFLKVIEGEIEMKEKGLTPSKEKNQHKIIYEFKREKKKINFQVL
jgi:hypothetical protein